MANEKASKKTIAAASIALIVASASPLIMKFEGKRNYPYTDVIGVLTVCYGHTGGIQSRRYSDAECRSMLDTDEGRHLTPILACAPGIADKPKVAAASLSLSYNIGAAGFCRSTAAKDFNAGKWADGCRAIGRYVYAGGRKFQGLVNRRKAEVDLCLQGANDG